MTENNEKCPECGETYSESGKQTPRLVQLKTGIMVFHIINQRSAQS